MNKKGNKQMSILDEFEEKNRLLKLQKDYENGIILEEELTKKQKEELMNLYNEQIRNLEDEIARSKVTLKMYKNKISKKMEKLKKNN